MKAKQAWAAMRRDTPRGPWLLVLSHFKRTDRRRARHDAKQELRCEPW